FHQNSTSSTFLETSIPIQYIVQECSSLHHFFYSAHYSCTSTHLQIHILVCIIIIFKLSKLPDKIKKNRSRRSISLFTNNYFCKCWIFSIGIIDNISIQKHNNVCILLNCTRFS